MKCTPASTMTLASAFIASRASARLSPTMSATQLEDFRRHVVVRQDHCVAFALERQDGVDIGGEHRPLDRRESAISPDRKAERHVRELRLQASAASHLMLLLSIIWLMLMLSNKDVKLRRRELQGGGRRGPISVKSRAPTASAKAGSPFEPQPSMVPLLVRRRAGSGSFLTLPSRRAIGSAIPMMARSMPWTKSAGASATAQGCARFASCKSVQPRYHREQPVGIVEHIQPANRHGSRRKFQVGTTFPCSCFAA